MRQPRIVGWSLRALLFALVLSVSTSSFALPPTVAVSGGRLRIGGVTPGASVAILGVVRGAGAFLTHVEVRRAVVTDDDHDGAVEYAPESAIPLRSIWLVADLESGEAAVAAPEGVTPVSVTQEGAGLGPPLAVSGNMLDLGRRHVQLLVVRPKHGAWTIGVRGSGTEPETAGRPRVNVAKLHPLHGRFGGPPAVLVPGDVILMLDEESMQYLVTTIRPGGK